LAAVGLNATQTELPMLTQKLLEATLIGSEWILYILLGLSVLSFTVIVERAIFYAANRKAWAKLAKRISPMIHAGRWEEVKQVVDSWPGPEVEVLRAAIEGSTLGQAATDKLVESALMLEQQRLDRRLAFLGTLGNNAPFLGLFGTVLGIIRAFHDLSGNMQGGANVVMSGISEALIATAVGLFVAIPAVIAYNYYLKSSSGELNRARAAVNDMMAALLSSGK
jgi:biopolymer transport protein ExbB/TolQ